MDQTITTQTTSDYLLKQIYSKNKKYEKII